MKQTKTKIAICATTFSSMFLLAASPGISLIKADPLFNGYSTATLQMIITVPSLLCIPTALMLDKLTTFVSKKRLAIFALVLMAIGGTAPFCIDSYFVILIMRGLVGISMGITTPLAPVLAVEYFEGKELNQVMGLSQASQSLGGALTALGAGILATAGWRESYLIHLLVVPALVLVVLFLKDTGKVIRKQKENQFKKLNLKTLYYCTIIAAFQVCMNTYSTNISMFMKAKGIGTPADAGTALSLVLLGCVVSGLVFGPIAGTLKKYTLGLGLFFIGAGLFLVGFSASLLPVMVGGFIAGFGVVVIMSEGSILLASTVSAGASALAVSLGMASMNLGQFASPMVITPLSALIIKNSEWIRFVLAGSISIGLAALFIVITLISNRFTGEETSALSKEA